MVTPLTFTPKRNSFITLFILRFFTYSIQIPPPFFFFFGYVFDYFSSFSSTEWYVCIKTPSPYLPFLSPPLHLIKRKKKNKRKNLKNKEEIECKTTHVTEPENTAVNR